MDDSTRQRLIDLLAPIHDRVRATARRLESRTGDGDDLFQETLLKACQKLSTLRDAEKFPMWFHRILINTHRNRVRRSFWKRFVRLETERPAEMPDDRALPNEEWFHRAERLSRALATLPSVQREAVVLAEIQGYVVEEIAAMQRVTPAAVKSRLLRGRERLRRHYTRVLGMEPARPPELEVAHEEGGPA